MKETMWWELEFKSKNKTMNYLKFNLETETLGGGGENIHREQTKHKKTS